MRDAFLLEFRIRLMEGIRGAGGRRTLDICSVSNTEDNQNGRAVMSERGRLPSRYDRETSRRVKAPTSSPHITPPLITSPYYAPYYASLVLLGDTFILDRKSIRRRSGGNHMSRSWIKAIPLLVILVFPAQMQTKPGISALIFFKPEQALVH